MSKKKNKSPLAAISAVLLVLIIAASSVFVFKTQIIECHGKYASNRLVKTQEYGLCLLVTYSSQYKVNSANGYAITNLKYTDFVTNEYLVGNNTNSLASDSDLYNAYVLTAGLMDNKFVSGISKAVSGISTQSVEVGKYGRYFIVDHEDVGELFN